MTPRCPTCGAAFRGADRCGRCGTDLSRLGAVLLAARALREEARRALLEHDPDLALDRIARSRRIQETELARRLEALALLMADRPREGLRLAAALLDA